MLVKNLLIYVFSFLSLFSLIMLLLTFYEKKHLLNIPKPIYYKLSVIIPAYNEEDNVAEAIESVLNLDYPRDKLDPIVVDDGSKDDTLEVARQYEDQGVRVFSKKNNGKAAALNFGLKKAKGEIIAPLDADCYMMPESVKKMIGYFKKDDVAAVGPAVKIWRTNNLLEKIQRIEFLTTTLVRKIFTSLGGLHLLPGPGSLFRKSFLDEHGGWSTNTITEDLEISLRIESEKYMIENSLNASVYTKGASTLEHFYRQRLRWFKGFIENMWSYRHMMFSPSYGNMGLFILPTSVLSIGVGILMFFYSVIMFVVNFISNMYELYLIGWDITTWFTFSWDPFFFNTSPARMLPLVLGVMTVFMIYLARKHDDSEKPIKSASVLFLLSYWFLSALCWISAAYHKATKKSVQWKTLRWDE